MARVASDAAVAAQHVFSSEAPLDPRVRALFHITAQCDPGLLPRLLEPVAKLGYVPMRVHATRESGDGSELTVDLRLGALAREHAETVARGLRAVIGVSSVIAVLETER